MKAGHLVISYINNGMMKVVCEFCSYDDILISSEDLSSFLKNAFYSFLNECDDYMYWIYNIICIPDDYFFRLVCFHLI